MSVGNVLIISATCGCQYLSFTFTRYSFQKMIVGSDSAIWFLLKIQLESCSFHLKVFKRIAFVAKCKRMDRLLKRGPGGYFSSYTSTSVKWGRGVVYCVINFIIDCDLSYVQYKFSFLWTKKDLLALFHFISSSFHWLEWKSALAVLVFFARFYSLGSCSTTTTFRTN